jgi:hypothetical protein
MNGAQVAVARYCPDWWPADTRLLNEQPRHRSACPLTEGR